MKILHIMATPREHKSNTLAITAVFLTELKKKYSDLSIDVVDLFNEDLPAVAGDNIEAKYHLMQGLKIDPKHKESWKQIEFLIDHFMKADTYLISTPMWNFSIPYALKYYIDCIVQPGYLFRYDEQGNPIGMVNGKKMVCVTSRGGDYTQDFMKKLDFQETYLRAIFGFCGISDIQFISAQPMDITPELRETALKTAKKQAKQVAANLEHSSRVTA